MRVVSGYRYGAVKGPASLTPMAPLDPCGGVVCPAGRWCVEGACVNGCEGTVCPAGQSCQSGGICVPDAPAPPTWVPPAPASTLAPAPAPAPLRVLPRTVLAPEPMPAPTATASPTPTVGPVVPASAVVRAPPAVAYRPPRAQPSDPDVSTPPAVVSGQADDQHKIAAQPQGGGSLLPLLGLAFFLFR